MKQRTDNPPRTRVLAISSGGGHWVQLLRLKGSFDGCEVHYACPDKSAAFQVSPAPFHAYPDCNLNKPLRAIIAMFHILVLLIRVRPTIIVSTGAAGGVMAIALGRLFGIRGLFIDSIANAHALSLSARIALKTANAVFTQWPDVAASTPAAYRGNVL
jgi:UDP-N-acetylglucosamine:LPS N-acetylglucosamine transferase